MYIYIQIVHLIYLPGYKDTMVIKGLHISNIHLIFFLTGMMMNMDNVIIILVNTDIFRR
jgi:hypothetical protein